MMNLFRMLIMLVLFATSCTENDHTAEPFVSDESSVAATDDQPVVPELDKEIAEKISSKGRSLAEAGGRTDPGEVAELHELVKQLVDASGQDHAIRALKEMVVSQDYHVVHALLLRGVMPAEKVDSFVKETLEPGLVEIYDKLKVKEEWSN